MEHPNRMALDLVDEGIDFAEELGVEVHHTAAEAAILDFGVEAAGGVEAGLLLAEVATGGLATVQTRVDTVAGAALPHVELSTDHPALALLGCQAPAWGLESQGETARGSGPARLLRGDGEPPGSAGLEAADFAVLALESSRTPGAALVETVATETSLPASAVFVAVAPADSLAGSVVATARVAERAVAPLVAAGVDPREVRSVTASAPVAPLAGSHDEGRARAAAAIAEGGRAHVVVESAPEEPGRALRADADGDLPAPAQVTIDVVGGPTHAVGGVDRDALADALGL